MNEDDQMNILVISLIKELFIVRIKGKTPLDRPPERINDDNNNKK